MGPESVSDLVAALYRRRLTLFLVLAGSMTGAGLFLDLVPREWKATASVFVQANPSRLSLHSGAANVPSGPIVPDTRLETALGLLGVASGGLLQQRLVEKFPEFDYRALRKNIVLDTDRFKQLNITAYDRKRERAVMLANEARDQLIQVLRENVEMAPRANLALFREELKAAEARHAEAQNALLAYLDHLDTADLEVDVSRLFQDRARYVAQLENLDREERRMNAERPVIRAIIAERPEFELMSRSLGRNSVHAQLVGRIADLDTRIAVGRMQMTDEFPSMATLLEQRRLAQKQLEEELEMIESGSTLRLDDQSRSLLTDLIQYDIAEASLGPRRTAFQELLEGVETKLGEVPLNRTELAELEEKVRRAAKLADDLKSRIYELELQLRRGLDFTWTDKSRTASVDRASQVPGRSGVFLFAALAGIIVGVLLSLAMELVHQLRRSRPF